MKTFTTDIIADSVNPDGKRVTSFLLTYPRFIHSELMTHRAFSRNAASSRAIPIEKVIKQIEETPAMPVRWGVNGKGMQDHGLHSDPDTCVTAWKQSAASAVNSAYTLRDMGLHKQIVNRVLEPFVWMTTLVTATEWENFYSLRVHKDAQPEFQHLSYLMLKTYLSSTPTPKDWGEWHIPFGDRMPEGLDIATKLKIATARAARTSYLTMDGQIDVDKDMALHDNLASSGHWSPFEHSCQAVWAVDWIPNNFRGWNQYRHQFSNENRVCDLQELLNSYEATLKTEDKQ